MELMLAILLLITLIMLFTIHTTHKSVVNQKLIEQRWNAYLHALEIAPPIPLRTANLHVPVITPMPHQRCNNF